MATSAALSPIWPGIATAAVVPANLLVCRTKGQLHRISFANIHNGPARRN